VLRYAKAPPISSPTPSTTEPRRISITKRGTFISSFPFTRRDRVGGAGYYLRFEDVTGTPISASQVGSPCNEAAAGPGVRLRRPAEGPREHPGPQFDCQGGNRAGK